MQHSVAAYGNVQVARAATAIEVLGPTAAAAAAAAAGGRSNTTLW